MSLRLFETEFGQYRISNDRSLLSIDKIMSFLSKSYWAASRPEETVRESIRNSECFGVYSGSEQVGFARIVTDYAVVYWLCDVYIEESHRKMGLGKKLIEVITENETLRNLNGILGTSDAHSLYEKYGFVQEPRGFMRKKVQS
jgi:GNAT superfamily N-acetyltransferase